MIYIHWQSHLDFSYAVIFSKNRTTVVNPATSIHPTHHTRARPHHQMDVDRDASISLLLREIQWRSHLAFLIQQLAEGKIILLLNPPQPALLGLGFGNFCKAPSTNGCGCGCKIKSPGALRSVMEPSCPRDRWTKPPVVRWATGSHPNVMYGGTEPQ